MPEPATDALPFEAALRRLEGIVERLESGELPLEEALAVFEEGVGLSRGLGAQLESAERRVEQLLREGTGTTTRPLGSEPE
jgi:exodeoxyribonuclease VII small subunit